MQAFCDEGLMGWFDAISLLHWLLMLGGNGDDEMAWKWGGHKQFLHVMLPPELQEMYRGHW